ncbi:MAG: ATP-binding protein [Oscillospiraceae bacterium]|nr:ATP-binding protein [Oscillospiraceae bacterium]
MAYSSNINLKADEILNQKRLRALDKQDKVKEKLFKEIPRLQEIEQELSLIGAEAAKAVIMGGSAKKTTTSLAEKSLALQKEMRTILFMHGYDEDILELHYECEKCKDTGRYDDETGRTVYCDCLKKLRANLACEELNKVSPLSLSTFDSFSLDNYDMDIQQGSITSPYDRMSKIFDYCKRYAKDFGTDCPSIMMRGATGLGKTHLSLAIANEVIKKGFGVVYVSAPMILSTLEKSHFKYAYKEEDEVLNTLLNCDLLILDDLGTEFQTNYSKSTVYNIFNTRLLNKKPTIMSSNLTLKEMEEMYTPRFVSRIMGDCAKLDFLGNDFRKPRKG